MDKTLYYMQKAIEEIAVNKARTLFFMPKPTQYTMPVKSLAVGDCGTVKFM